MAVGYGSNRLAIAQALVAQVLPGIIDPTTSQTYYPLIKLGAIKNPMPNARFAQITHYEGQSGPYGSGGLGTSGVGWRIDDEITYLFTSGYGPYQNDDTAAQEAMLSAMDTVKPQLHTYFRLPQPDNSVLMIPSVYSVLPTLKDRSIPRLYPNGNFYLLWHQPIVVKQQYNVTLTEIGA